MGNKGWPCKLTAETVTIMKAEYLSGVTFEQLGAKYGVGRRTAARAVRGENWKHVGKPITINFYRHRENQS